MTIYLIYPHDRTRRASAPWSIGYNLATGLRKRGHQVRCYDWDEELCVYPDGPEDILIGHPHPEPGKCFRTSMVAPWKKVVSIAPWNGSEEYRRDQEYVWKRVDHHFAICGAGWWPSNKPSLIYSSPTRPATRLDMAIDPKYFPPLKPSYNPPSQRRFLYIGCTVPIKGTEYLTELVMQWNGTKIGHIGHGTVAGAKEHGYLDLQSDYGKSIVAQYDYLIMPGIHDANPTTVLEAMAWGLIPVLSSGCGYVEDDYHGYRLSRDVGADAALLKGLLQSDDESELIAMAGANRSMVKSRYTWPRFVNAVASVLEA